MSLETDIRPITYLKARASDLLKQVNETHRHVVITQNGEAKAVLQDPASFEEMRTALTLMKMISQSEDAIRRGDIMSNEDVFNDLEKRLKDR
ncbi:MAG: type II toxin-antitoxin system Phd/YefM family antitoxin [Deltaproteobacteria bacterium]|nr:type II toxin-antitoxin system Phd/YefM family antitoxin [Deltaproteobacteria bacterium]